MNILVTLCTSTHVTMHVTKKSQFISSFCCCKYPPIYLPSQYISHIDLFYTSSINRRFTYSWTLPYVEIFIWYVIIRVTFSDLFVTHSDQSDLLSDLTWLNFRNTLHNDMEKNIDYIMFSPVHATFSSSFYCCRILISRPILACLTRWIPTLHWLNKK